MATHNDNELRERPLGEVAKNLTSDLSLLVRQEIELAKAEMADKGRTAAPGVDSRAPAVAIRHTRILARLGELSADLHPALGRADRGARQCP